MRTRTITLYSLPYVVSVASLLVAAHEVAPSLTTLRASPGASPQIESVFGQSVNRALKGDRLPIRQTIPSGGGQDRPQAPGTVVIAAR